MREYALKLHYSPGNWTFFEEYGKIWTTTDPEILTRQYKQFAQQVNDPNKWVAVFYREVPEWAPHPNPV